MLEQAKVKASEAGLEINFIEADIRTLNLQEKFDFIFIPFNSIHHLYRNEDLFKALKRVENHLKEGGLFLLDCFNPNIQYIVEGEKEQKVVAEYTTSDGREVLIKQIMYPSFAIGSVSLPVPQQSSSILLSSLFSGNHFL